MEKVENMKKKMGRFSKTYGNDKIINLKAQWEALQFQRQTRNLNFFLPFTHFWPLHQSTMVACFHI